jgi:hypothetical protein
MILAYALRVIATACASYFFGSIATITFAKCLKSFKSLTSKRANAFSMFSMCCGSKEVRSRLCAMRDIWDMSFSSLISILANPFSVRATDCDSNMYSIDRAIDDMCSNMRMSLYSALANECMMLLTAWCVCVCGYVCMLPCVYVCVCIYIYIYTHTHIYIYIHIYIHVYIYTYAPTGHSMCLTAYTFVCTFTYGTHTPLST